MGPGVREKLGSGHLTHHDLLPTGLQLGQLEPHGNARLEPDARQHQGRLLHVAHVPEEGRQPDQGVQQLRHQLALPGRRADVFELW